MSNSAQFAAACGRPATAHPQAAPALQQIHSEKVGAARHPYATIVRHAGRVPASSRDHPRRRPRIPVRKPPRAGAPRPTPRTPPATLARAALCRAGLSPPFEFLHPPPLQATKSRSWLIIVNDDFISMLISIIPNIAPHFTERRLNPVNLHPHFYSLRAKAAYIIRKRANLLIY